MKKVMRKTLILLMIVVLTVSGLSIVVIEKASAATTVIKMLEGLATSSIALKTDGTVWAWGANNYGQLGNGKTTDSLVPTQTSISEVISIASGEQHSIALKSDGSVWTWGHNSLGQLGNNSATNAISKVPVQVLTGAVAVASGATHSLALKYDGTVWAWGNNTYGQLGNNSTTNSKIPVQVSNLSGVTSIASGYNYSIAIKSDGSVWAWGANTSGQLGINSTTNSKVPIQVPNLSGVTSITGSTFSIALKSDGTVWTWGRNNYGQLGINSTTNSLIPVQVPNLSGITAIAGGESHALALKSDGTVWSWGRNENGQVGNGKSGYGVYSKVPAQVLTDVTAIASGFYHSFAIKSDGTFWAWGGNSHGQLGNGTKYTPYKVPDKVSWDMLAPDKISPVITLTASTTALTNHDVTVTVTATDESGVSVLKYNSGSQAKYGTTIKNGGTFTVSENGTFSAYAMDVAGNETAQTITISNIDKTQPIISLTTNSTAATNPNVSVTVTAIDTGSGIASLKYSSGIQTASYFASNGTTLSGSVSTFAASTDNSYTVYAKDGVGNEVLHMISFATQYHFDVSGRLDYIQLPSGEKLKYYYDNNGNLLSIQRQ